MRQNQPVTHREHPYPDDTTLLSLTDTDSRIRYANGAFIDVSGFDAGELTGEPHNLVRHPDMPAEAFADLWRTLRAGQVWSALVKNRRKNGDHYWVRANVTPVRRDGRVTGYLSVRTRPEREEIAAAEALYASMRAGTASFRLQRGLLVGKGWRRPLSWMKTASSTVRAWFGVVMGASTGAAAAWAIQIGTGHAAVAALGGAAIATLITGAWIQRQFVAPLRALLDDTLRCASGVRPDARTPARIDDIGMLARAINQCGLNVCSLIDDIGRQADGVARASESLVSETDGLAERSAAAAGSLQQTAAAIEQISTSIREVADRTREADLAAHAAAEAAGQCTRSMGGIAETMGEIRAAGERIAGIIGVIDGIAFQTNILALNAAVEAARAGEQGRGFAVVAAEVRTLDQRCTVAATEVKAVVGANAHSTANGAARIDEATRTVQAALAHVDETARLIAGISTAAAEQSTGTSQVSEAIGQLDAVTQRNALLVDGCRDLGGALNQQAKRLSEAVAVFG